MAVAELKRVIKKKQKKQYEQITCSVSLFCNASFLKCLIVDKNASIYPCIHRMANIQRQTGLHTHTAFTHTNIQKLLVLALFSTAKLLSLSPRLRLYYLLLYYTTPTFTPAPRE